MYDYSEFKIKHGTPVSQTVDEPIIFLNFWEIGDLCLGMIIILIFGTLFYAWWTMITLLIVAVVIVPIVKRNHNRGVFQHWFYKNLGLSLPSLMNPKGRRKFSD